MQVPQRQEIIRRGYSDLSKRRKIWEKIAKKYKKKKAQKAAKHRAQKAQHKKFPTLRGSGSSFSIRGALDGPVYECWEPKQLFSRDTGVGPVVITRKAPQHKMLIAVFLIDILCLGVKDAYIKLLSEEE